MAGATQIEKAGLFRKLHDGRPILVLPNAWDAVGARIFEEAGFPAVATTSAGVAWALGYPDGERVDRAEMLAAVGRIARSVAVPVTADIEAGFGDTPSVVAETVEKVIAAGAVGINLEDSDKGQDKALVAVEVAVAKIQAARAAADRSGVPLVINARTDVYLAAIGEPAERFDHAGRRANAYRAAGADCLFVPAVRDGDTIGRLVRALDGPLNILAGPGCPPTAELQALGVCRLSVGSGPMTAALTLVRRIAEELKASGTFAAFTQGSVPYAEWNRLMGER
jgi:2-methylisocitrate lyase-like PEP mutase family enzyme